MKKFRMLLRTDPLLDKSFYIIGWVLGGIALLLLAGIQSGLLDIFAPMSHCVFHAATGYYCPGCGGTRAVKCFFQGKILASLYYHPIVVYTAVFAGWFMFSQTVERLSKGKCRIGMHYRDIYLWAALLIVMLNCIIKNAVLAITGIALMA